MTDDKIILVVDESPSLGKVLSGMLDEFGFDVSVAELYIDDPVQPGNDIDIYDRRGQSKGQRKRNRSTRWC